MMHKRETFGIRGDLNYIWIAWLVCFSLLVLTIIDLAIVQEFQKEHALLFVAALFAAAFTPFGLKSLTRIHLDETSITRRSPLRSVTIPFAEVRMLRINPAKDEMVIVGPNNKIRIDTDFVSHQRIQAIVDARVDTSVPREAIATGNRVPETIETDNAEHTWPLTCKGDSWWRMPVVLPPLAALPCYVVIKEAAEFDPFRLMDWIVYGGLLLGSAGMLAVAFWNLRHGVRRVVFYPDKIEVVRNWRTVNYTPGDLNDLALIARSIGARNEPALYFKLGGNEFTFPNGTVDVPLRILYRRLRDAYGDSRDGA